MLLSKLISATILVFCSQTVSGFTDFQKELNGSIQDVVGVDDPSVGIVVGPDFNALDVLKSSSNNLKFGAAVYRQNRPIGRLVFKFDFNSHPFKFIDGDYSFEAKVYRVMMSFNGFFDDDNSDKLRSLAIYPVEPSSGLTEEKVQMHLDKWESLLQSSGWIKFERIGANFTWPKSYDLDGEPYAAWQYLKDDRLVEAVLRVTPMGDFEGAKEGPYNIRIDIDVD